MRKVVNHTDAASINKWLAKRGHPPCTNLPETGFIVPGVCAGFVRHVEGGYLLLDSMVSNPLVSAQTRHKAMDRLFTQLLAIPATGHIGFTLDKGTFERAVRHGFTPSNHIVLTRNV